MAMLDMDIRRTRMTRGSLQHAGKAIFAKSRD